MKKMSRKASKALVQRIKDSSKKQPTQKEFETLNIKGQTYKVIRVLDLIAIEKGVSLHIFPQLVERDVIKQYLIRSSDNYNHTVYQLRNGKFEAVIPLGTRHFDPPAPTEAQKEKFAKFVAERRKKNNLNLTPTTNNQRKENGNDQKTSSEEARPQKGGSPEETRSNEGVRKFSFASRRGKS